jgi:putative oxidoreductase
MSPGIIIEFAVRCLLVVLFLPFSALDKIFNFHGAVTKLITLAVPSSKLATGLILAGLAVEIFMPLGIVTGIADRLAAFVLGGYCVVTALLEKKFWLPGDFWHRGDSKARDLFWDFLKNCSLAGGFMLLAFGTSSVSANHFLTHPLSSSHPYEKQRSFVP